MGLVMDTGSVKSQLADMNNNLENMVTKAGNLWSRINGFIDESGLNSDSYNNMKEYCASVHIPLLKGFISYAETLISSNERYSAQIDTYLSGVGYVDEDGLADELGDYI